MTDSLLLRPHRRHIGFDVMRLLPAAQRQRIGPFIFLDHMGPARFAARSRDGDVPPHPHIGLATVTYLFSGALEHRDSLGHVQRIEPGAINLMTAGRGISHSERIPADVRSRGEVVEGVQVWLALPAEEEECDPAFEHHDADQLPRLTFAGASARLLIGCAWNRASPVRTASETLYVDLSLSAGATLTLPAQPWPCGLYLCQGDLQVADAPLPLQHLRIQDRSAATVLHSIGGARLLWLGGETLPEHRHLRWNFVATRQARIDAAEQAWRRGDFPGVPGDPMRLMPPDR